MKIAATLITALALMSSGTANAGRSVKCTLSPKQVVTRFMTKLYIDRKPREAFEAWVDPGYIQHNPMAPTGRDAAIGFLEPFMDGNPNLSYSIKRIIADGNLVAVHAHGKFAPGDRGIAVVDILRVQGCKVVEHWDVVQAVPEKSANENTMF